MRRPCSTGGREVFNSCRRLELESEWASAETFNGLTGQVLPGLLGLSRLGVRKARIMAAVSNPVTSF